MAKRMIYSPGRRYLFIHIPKTGGTSMALALEDRAMRDDILVGDTPKAHRRRKRAAALPAKGRIWKHSTLQDLDGWLGPDALDDTFLFTMVRNPWDRLVSYYHWLRAARFDHPAVTLAQDLPFDAFLNAEETQASLKAAPSRSYMIDTSGMDRCRQYIRLEHLPQDLAPLEAHLGFALTLPRANASKRAQDYRSYYSDALAETVAHLMADDIAQFGYSFDPAPSKKAPTTARAPSSF